MKYALLISGLVELSGGIVLYLFPHLIVNPIQSNLAIFKLYGLSAIIIGLINLFAYRHYEETRFFKILFLLMFFFHGAIAMICYGIAQDSFTKNSFAIVTHLILFGIFLFTYLKDLKPNSL